MHVLFQKASVVKSNQAKMRLRCNDVYSKSDNVGFCVLDMKLNWVGGVFF